MKKLLPFITGLVLFANNAFSQSDSTINNPNYDKALAEKLAGDDYGMKSYFLVILKSGTNNSTDKELINLSFRGHFENMNKMVEAGKLVVAGPIGKNEDKIRGIFIIQNTKTEEEVKALLQNDLAIKNGFLDYTIYPWYGSAALPEYLPLADKIWRKNP